MENNGGLHGGERISLLSLPSLADQRHSQCVQGRTVLAEWRRADKHEEHNARVILKHASLPVVTEIFATLTLNRLREEQHRSTSTLR